MIGTWTARSAGLLLLAACSLSSTTCFAQTNVSFAGQRSDQRTFSQNATRQFAGPRVSLESQLRSGMRAVRTEQFVFIRSVVNLVNAKRLPEGLVQLVYRWSLEKNSKVPFPYFQFAMQQLAKRRGISIGTL